MRDYNGIPVWEIDEVGQGQGRRIFEFQNMVPIAIPANTPYAIVANGEEYYGVMVCNNGDKGFRRDEKEKVLVRTCSTFIAGGSRTDKCVEARI